MYTEAVIKTIPKKNTCKKAKWLSEEALQIAEERREANGKGKKERYTHLSAEFALKHVYHIRNKSPVQVRYRMLGAGALG